MLHLGHFLAGLIDEQFYRILIAHPVAADNSIVDMVLKGIIIFDDGRRSPLCRNGVAAHGIDFAHHGDIQIGIRFAYGDGGSESGAATTYNNNIML
jgi:hypothetical protein